MLNLAFSPSDLLLGPKANYPEQTLRDSWMDQDKKTHKPLPIKKAVIFLIFTTNT